MQTPHSEYEKIQIMEVSAKLILYLLISEVLK